jgi:hypothetical protein
MEYEYIHLTTKNTSYVLAINKYGHLENLYYGGETRPERRPEYFSE